MPSQSQREPVPGWPHASGRAWRCRRLPMFENLAAGSELGRADVRLRSGRNSRSNSVSSKGDRSANAVSAARARDRS